MLLFRELVTNPPPGQGRHQRPKTACKRFVPRFFPFFLLAQPEPLASLPNGPLSWPVLPLAAAWP